MKINIGYEDVIANALIELNTRYNVSEVSYEQLDNYEKKVIEELEKKGINAVCYVYRDIFENIKKDYNEYFIFNDNGVAINLNITADDLIAKFRGYLSIDALLAFVDNDVVGSLGQFENIDTDYISKRNKVFQINNNPKK